MYRLFGGRCEDFRTPSYERVIVLMSMMTRTTMMCCFHTKHILSGSKHLPQDWLVAGLPLPYTVPTTSTPHTVRWNRILEICGMLAFSSFWVSTKIIASSLHRVYSFISFFFVKVQVGNLCIGMIFIIFYLLLALKETLKH